MQSMGEIKEILAGSVSREQLEAFIESFSGDERAGVKKLVETAGKRIAALNAEIERTEQMKQYEKQ